MPTVQNIEWGKFRLGFLRCTFLPSAPLSLEPPIGVALRGGLGAALRNLNCLARHPCPDRCFHPHRCVYGRLFETPVPPDSPIFVRQFDAPRPFVIEPIHPALIPPAPQEPASPSAGVGRHTHTGPLVFNLVLFGQALDYLPQLIRALERMGRWGLNHVPCSLIRIESLAHRQDAQPVILYADPALPVSSAPRVINGNEIIHPDAASGPASSDQAADQGQTPSEPSRNGPGTTLTFLTPTQLTRKGKVAQSPDFETLIRALLRRLIALAWFHCDLRIELDFKGLVEQARGVEIVSDETESVRFTRHSKRQSRDLWLGGFTGPVTFSHVPEDLLPLLRLGEYTHVGKDTVYGLGQYEIG